MGLVNAKEVAKAINIDKYGFLGTLGGWTLMKVLRISSLNKLYDRHKDKNSTEFLNALLEDLQIEFEIPEEDLKGFLKKEVLLLYLIIP